MFGNTLKYLLFLIIWIPLASKGGPNHEVPLFTQDGSFVAGYETIVLGLQSGDYVVMSDGTTFRYLGQAFSGNTTKILKVQDSYGRTLALRIPLASGDVPKPVMQIDEQGRVHLTQQDYRYFIDLTLSSYSMLKKTGDTIPSVRFAKASEYIALDWVDFDIAGEDFFSEKRKELNQEIQDKAEKAFLDLVVQVVNLSEIGDLSAKQLVYSIKKNKWYILDWTGAKESRWIGSSHPFSDFRSSLLTAENNFKLDSWSKQLIRKIGMRVYAARLSALIFVKSKTCEQLF